MEDGRIVELLLARNESGLQAAAAKYGRRLRQIGRRLIGDEETVEECENDTYLQAWNSIPPHAPRDYLFAFLARIMRHRVLSACEAGRRLKRRGALSELTEEMEQCIPAPDDTAGTVDGILLGEAVSAFLRTVSEERRTIFLRRYWYFETVEEIAREMGIGESKVKTALFRTRNSLREYLKKEGYNL